MTVEDFVSLDLSIFFGAQTAGSLGEQHRSLNGWVCVRRTANWSGRNIFIFSVTLVSQIGLEGRENCVDRQPDGLNSEKKISDRHINQTQGVLCSKRLIFTFIPSRVVAFDLCEELKQLRASLSLSAIIKWFLNSHSQIPSIIIDTQEIKYLFFFSSSAHILTTH